jgi:hypothetical protein
LIRIRMMETERGSDNPVFMFDLLPPLTECDALIVKEDDVLITAGGCEDRALAAAELLQTSAGGCALVIRYEPGDERNRLTELVTVLEAKGLKTITTIDYNRYEPHGFCETLSHLVHARRVRRVVLDLSAMSKLALLLAMDTLCELSLEVEVFYAEAQSYGPSEKEYLAAKRGETLFRPSIQFATGVYGLVRTPRLASVAMQGQPTAGIVFMSFNELLTQALLNTVNPGRLFLINGRPPELGWREEATAWIHEELRKEWAGDNPVGADELGHLLPLRVTSTRDYRETLVELLRLYWLLASDYRILLAPTGSKMQTVGSFFVKSLHPDIHVEYPTPKGYLDLFSWGIGRRWHVVLGNLGTKVKRLRLEERKRLLGVLP